MIHHVKTCGLAARTRSVRLKIFVPNGPGATDLCRGSPGPAGCQTAVRADQDRAAAGDLPGAQPGAARVVQVAVEVADPHRVEREVRLRGELPGRLAPWLALLAGDQQEPARRHEVLDRAAVAVLIVDPGVRQRGTGTGGRLIHADPVDRRGRGAAVGHDGRGLIAVAVFDVELAELHRLRPHHPQHARAVPGVLGPAAPHPAQLLHVLLGRALMRDAGEAWPASTAATFQYRFCASWIALVRPSPPVGG